MESVSPLLEKWKSSPHVDDIMAYVQKRIEERRKGGVLYDDEIRAETGMWLSEVLVDRAHEDSALRHYLDTIGEWRQQLHPNLSTHRGFFGRVFLWIKKKILSPPFRWIIEQVEVNAWRQDRLNLSLLDLIEELAMENGRLKARLAKLEKDK
jgi:hypothetical protein